MGASVNCVRHLTAMAIEAQCDIDILDAFRTVGNRVPLLLAVRPNGPDRIEEFDAVGGTRAVMAEIGNHLETAMTVTGI